MPPPIPGSHPRDQFTHKGKVQPREDLRQVPSHAELQLPDRALAKGAR